MPARKRARGAEAPLPPPKSPSAPPPARAGGRPTTRRFEAAEAYDRRLKLTDVIGYVALCGYTREADACAGLNRETWRCVPAGLGAADAARVRAGHPLWRAIIDLPHGESKDTRLVLAAMKGKVARVRELLDWGAHMEVAAGDSGWTPLLCATRNRHLAVVRELLKRGADVEATSVEGVRSLHIASSFGYLDIVGALLARGADVDAATDDGDTPLITASAHGEVKAVRALLAAGANKRLANNDGETAHDLADSMRYPSRGTGRAIRALLAAAP